SAPERMVENHPQRDPNRDLSWDHARDPRDRGGADLVTHEHGRHPTYLASGNHGKRRGVPDRALGHTHRLDAPTLARSDRARSCSILIASGCDTDGCLWADDLLCDRNAFTQRHNPVSYPNHTFSSHITRTSESRIND